MVSKIIFRLSLIIGIAALAYAGVNAVKQPAASTASNIETYEEVEIPLDAFREGRGVRSLDAFDTTIKIEDFELGPVWTSNDLTVAGNSYWHSDNVPIGDANAPAFWCGNSSLVDNLVAPGGYENHQEQYLTSPTLDLSGSSTPIRLAFKARWKLETPGGETAPYDMWDTWTVQYSSDGGTTWNIPAPADVSLPFTGTCAYAWSDHCYDGCYAGWGGTAHASAYEIMSINLDALAGQSNVKFRFAMLSDPAASANDGQLDSSYYGLIIDSVRFTNSTTTLLSNNGDNLTGWTAEAYPVAPVGDTWVYEDSTAPTGFTSIPDQDWSWNAEHRGLANISNALRSPVFMLPDTSLPGADPLAYQQLKLAYYVWADLLDSDGDDDGSLDDLYEIYITDDGGTTWTRVAYDYGTTALTGDDHPEAGNSLLGWVRRGKGLSTGGTAGDINLTPWGGHNVQLEFRLQTDCNNDGGIGGGLHIDYPVLVATRAFANDAATDNLVVPFPTTVGLVRPWHFDYVNEGSNAIGPTLRYRQLYKKPDGTNQGTDSLKILSGSVLNTNDFVTANIIWTPTVVGAHRIRVTTVLPGEQDFTNDTTYTPINAPLNEKNNMAVYVQPAGTYELGYHLRDYSVVLSNPRLVRYTPTADGVPAADADTMDINRVQVQWNWDPADINSLPDGTARCQLKFYGQGPDTYTPGALLYTYEEEIDTNETVSPYGGDSLLYRWWEVDLTNVKELKRIQGDFWIEVSALDTVAGAGLPGLLAIVTANNDTTDAHNYTRRLDIAGTPILASPSRFNVEVLAKPTVWPDPVTGLTVLRDLLTNDVVLRWSASNRADGYNVYRSTDPNNLQQTLLTPVPIAGTTYTDTSVLSASDKYFYVVTAVNQ
jgi:hypothetical protein